MTGLKEAGIIKEPAAGTKRGTEDLHDSDQMREADEDAASVSSGM